MTIVELIERDRKRANEDNNFNRKRSIIIIVATALILFIEITRRMV